MNERQKLSDFFPKGKYFLQIDVDTDASDSLGMLLGFIRNQNDMFPGIKVSQLYFNGTDVDSIAKSKAQDFVSKLTKEIEDGLLKINKIN